MVHILVDDLVDEMANGSALVDRVGTIMDRTASGRRVFEERNGVNTGVVVVAGRPALGREINKIVTSTWGCEYYAPPVRRSRRLSFQCLPP